MVYFTILTVFFVNFGEKNLLIFWKVLNQCGGWDPSPKSPKNGFFCTFPNTDVNEEAIIWHGYLVDVTAWSTNAHIQIRKYKYKYKYANTNAQIQIRKYKYANTDVNEEAIIRHGYLVDVTAWSTNRLFRATHPICIRAL